MLMKTAGYSVLAILCLLALGCASTSTLVPPADTCYRDGSSQGSAYTFSVNAWNTSQRPGYFPELQDPDFRSERLAKLWEAPGAFSVAFSGGGTRSASATLGQLRALHSLGWIDKVQYISAISGGSWASVPYTFWPAGHEELEKYFLGLTDGRMPAPEDVSDTMLETRSDPASLSYAISHANIFWKSIWNMLTLQADKSYAKTLNSVFLERMELGERRFFTTEERRDDVPCFDSESCESGYYFAPKDRPYLIVGGTVFEKKKFSKSDVANIKHPIELTPTYAGLSQVSAHRSPGHEKRSS